MSTTSGAMVVVQVSDGQNDLVFNPTEINAQIGDTVRFEFMSGNHSVARGDFSNPCAPAAVGGFYSGFIPAAGAIASGNVCYTARWHSPCCRLTWALL